MRKMRHVTHMSVSVWSGDDSLQANNTETERALDDPDCHCVSEFVRFDDSLRAHNTETDRDTILHD